MTAVDSLTALRLAFLADRAAMDAAHPPTGVRDRCRYCGGTWQLWNGGRFDGHVRCAVSPAFQHQLVDQLERDIRLTYATIALALGVSTSVVRAWWQNIKAPRRRPSAPRSEVTS
jgi:hypothetical protein